MEWEIARKRVPKLTSPVLVEGLPGIGNVGKIAIDYIIQASKAKKIMQFNSAYLPTSVYVTEKNTVKLPEICIYHCHSAKRDFLLLTGESQPVSEEGCYSFCTELLKEMKSIDCSFIMTLGGIGQAEICERPLVYCTSSKKSVVNEIKSKTKVITELFGVVGPIMGVTGMLLGASEKYKIPSAALLADTLAHPMYYGVFGAKEILLSLKRIYGLNFELKKLEKEVKELADKQKHSSLQNLQEEDTNYIG